MPDLERRGAMFRSACAGLIFGCVVAGCGAVAEHDGTDVERTTTVTENTRDWTILVYVAADEESIREPEIAMLKRIEAMPELREPLAKGRVGIAVQHDDVGDDPNYRYALPPIDDGAGFAWPKPPVLAHTTPVLEGTIRKTDPGFAYGERDSGDPRTLASFVRWGIHALPAKHYGLVISGHSWGKLGVMQDFFVDGKDIHPSTLIKHYELRRVMEEIYREKNPVYTRDDIFDFLIVDACITGQLDVALEYSDVFKYFAASTLETPDNAFPFELIFGEFMREVAKSEGRDPKRLLEEHLFKPFVRRYVEAHAPGGGLVGLEKEIDAVEAFVVRTQALPALGRGLADMLVALPPETVRDWRAGRLKSLEALQDMDRNVDLLALTRALVRHLNDKTAGDDAARARAVRAAEAFVALLGYRADDPTDLPTAVAHPTAAGAWAHVQVDEVARRDLAVCAAVRSFALLNADNPWIKPLFADADGPTNPADVDCGDLSDEHPSDGPDQPLAGPVAIPGVYDLTFTWPSGVPAYLSEEGGRRTLSVWIPRAAAPVGTAPALARSVFLRLPATRAIDLDYLSGDPTDFLDKGKMERRLAGEHFDVAPNFVVDDPRLLAGGLYVAEGHSSGSQFKHGLGIFFDHAIAVDDPDLPYNAGRTPVERVEARPYALSLDDYLDGLARKGTLQTFPLKGPEFYRAHRIDRTGWPDFLFGPER
jgi:hypothetical protein